MSSFLPANLPAILAWLVVYTTVPIMWGTAMVFTTAVVIKPKNLVLRSAWVLVLWLTMLVTVFGLVFINNDTVPPRFTLYETQVMTRTAIWSTIFPGLYLLNIWRPVLLSLVRDRRSKPRPE